MSSVHKKSASFTERTYRSTILSSIPHATLLVSVCSLMSCTSPSMKADNDNNFSALFTAPSSSSGGCLDDSPDPTC